MGQMISSLQYPLHVARGSVAEIISGRKRKRDDEGDSIPEENTSALESTLQTPKKYELCFSLMYENYEL